MKILSIDTSSSICSIAILENKNVIKEMHNYSEKEHSETLMPMIDELFKSTNLSLDDINLIACSVGPGSFTGIRVGLTVAKTMAYTLNIPIVSVSSLEVMASGKAGTALINARRGYVFAGSYDENLGVIYPDSYVLMSDELNKPYISYDSFDFDTLKPNIDVLKVIRKHENDKPVNPHAIKPNYLKMTEAEENLKKHDRES